jgi:hypothetical protein
LFVLPRGRRIILSGCMYGTQDTQSHYHVDRRSTFSWRRLRGCIDLFDINSPGCSFIMRVGGRELRVWNPWNPWNCVGALLSCSEHFSNWNPLILSCSLTIPSHDETFV